MFYCITIINRQHCTTNITKHCNIYIVEIWHSPFKSLQIIHKEKESELTNDIDFAITQLMREPE